MLSNSRPVRCWKERDSNPRYHTMLVLEASALDRSAILPLYNTAVHWENIINNNKLGVERIVGFSPPHKTHIYLYKASLRYILRLVNWPWHYIDKCGWTSTVQNHWYVDIDVFAHLGGTKMPHTCFGSNYWISENGGRYSIYDLLCKCGVAGGSEHPHLYEKRQIIKLQIFFFLKKGL